MYRKYSILFPEGCPLLSLLCVCVCVCVCLVTQSCPTLCDPMNCSLPGSSIHGDSPGKNSWLSCHALLQGIFPTQGLNPGLPRCSWILDHLSHQGSPWILEWAAYPFSRGSSWPRNRTRVSCIAGRFFANWAIREAPIHEYLINDKVYPWGVTEKKYDAWKFV